MKKILISTVLYVLLLLLLAMPHLSNSEDGAALKGTQNSEKVVEDASKDGDISGLNFSIQPRSDAFRHAEYLLSQKANHRHAILGSENDLFRTLKRTDVGFSTHQPINELFAGTIQEL